MEDLDQRVRQQVYTEVLATGRIPTSAELAATLTSEPPAVQAALIRLAEARVLVLQPGGEILMTPPFSAVPTPFLVIAEDTWQTYGNCIWDALGVLAMKGVDGRIHTACGCCGQAMEIEVRDGAPREAEGVLHFAIPARRWWEDIVYT
jgi:Alkylmercury lyase